MVEKENRKKKPHQHDKKSESHDHHQHATDHRHHDHTHATKHHKTQSPKKKTENQAVPHQWFILTLLSLSVSLIVIDGTIVNVALPVIMKDLHLSFTNVEWIVTLYSLIFSALLLTTGRLADAVGRKKMLIIGIAIFLVGSTIASLSSNIQWMLIARSIQGVGGATVLPTTLSVVNAIFTGKNRIIAFAVWGSVIAGMAALGPLLGGFLTTYFTWRWIFWINIPIGIFIIIGALMVLPETYGEKMKTGFDLLGFLLSTIGLGTLVFALIEGRNYGWWKAKGDHLHIGSISIIPVLLFIGIICIALFLVWEQHLISQKKSHLLDISLFRFRSFSLGNTIACLIAIGESGLLFLLPLFLQNVLLFSPMESGWMLASMGIGAFFAGGMASGLVKKTSAKTVVSIGLFLETIGFVGFFLTVKPDIAHWILVLWLVFYGVGLGFASAQLTSIVLVDVPKKASGQGSSIQSTTRQLGSALGVAIIGTILVGFLQKDIPNTLKNADLPPQEQKAFEKQIIDSAGSAIKEVKQIVANQEKMEHEEDHNDDAYQNQDKKINLSKRENVSETLDKNFTKSVDKTIGISSIFIIIGLILTFFLKNPKPTSPPKKRPTSHKKKKHHRQASTA